MVQGRNPKKNIFPAGPISIIPIYTLYYFLYIYKYRKNSLDLWTSYQKYPETCSKPVKLSNSMESWSKDEFIPSLAPSLDKF